MTEQMDYATMPAGVEMDAEIARRVMEWPTIGMNTPFREAGNAHGVVVREDDGWLKPMRFARVGDACPLDDSWRPSTDIAAAWEVLEVIRQRFGNVSLTVDNGWGLTIWRNDHCMTVGPLNSDSAQLAICRAALLAVAERQP
jgi:hypothetical protein